MKLLLCTNCQHVFKLEESAYKCPCGACGGQYMPDGLCAIYWGDCVPIGFNNSSLKRAVQNQPDYGRGETFDAFVIPKNCPRMLRMEKEGDELDLEALKESETKPPICDNDSIKHDSLVKMVQQLKEKEIRNQEKEQSSPT